MEGSHGVFIGRSPSLLTRAHALPSDLGPLSRLELVPSLAGHLKPALVTDMACELVGSLPPFLLEQKGPQPAPPETRYDLEVRLCASEVCPT